MPAVPTVHEKVQQRTQQNQKVRQDAEQVRPVFGYQVECGDGYEAGQRQLHPRTERTVFR